MNRTAVVAFLVLIAPACFGQEVADGLYHGSKDANAPRVKTTDGRWVSLGQKCPLDTLVADVYAINNGNTRFGLTVRIPFRPGIDCPPWKVLVVGGIADLTSSQGYSSSRDQKREVCRHHFWISGRDRADRIARHFGVMLRLRQHPGHRLTASFVPLKTAFETGSSPSARFRLTNVGSEAVAFLVGGRSRASRDNQYAFSACYQGQQVTDIGSSDHFGGHAVKHVLAPGECYEKVIDLTKWFSFATTGRYDVFGSFYIEFVDPEGSLLPSTWEDHATAAFSVEIREPSRPPSAEADEPVMRIYDIRDLTPRLSVFPTDSGDYFSFSSELRLGVDEEMQANRDKLDPAAIVAEIKRRTEGAWGEGTRIETRYGKLIVVQSQQVHERIATILAFIRTDPSAIRGTADRADNGAMEP